MVIKWIPKLTPGQHPNSFVSWLAKVVRSEIVDEIRRQKAPAVSLNGNKDLREPVVDHQLSAEAKMTRLERAEIVRSGLEQLRGEVADLTFQVICLRYMDRASVKEVSQALDLSPQQVWDRCRSGVAKLKRILSDLKPDGGPSRRRPK